MIDTNNVTETDTEEELIAKAQTAVSRCNWIVGECAAQWTRRYARGRTDTDFAVMVGLSPDQVYQRRRVWESFGDVAGSYSRLKWSHFYVALNWDDAPECLAWAEEHEATVSEMRAWRRAQRGEDLSIDPAPLDAWAGDPAISFVPSEPTIVRDLDQTADARPAVRPAGERDSDTRAAQREGSETAYAPFRKDAGTPAARDGERSASNPARPEPPPEALLKRMVSALERMNAALTPGLLAEYRKLPRELRNRLVDAAAGLNDRVAALS